MSNALDVLQADHGTMKEWFEHMHRNPELSMREEKTAKYIADIVGQWGYEVETGVGRHGIVASLTVTAGRRSGCAPTSMRFPFTR